MRSRVRGLKVPLAALAAAALVVISPGAATAGEDRSVDDVVTELEQEFHQPENASEESPEQEDGATAEDAEVDTATQTASSEAASDSDQPGHETDDPKAPDHAGSEIADIDAGPPDDRQDAVDAGHNDATVEDDDSTSADATLLALGGQEVIGAHADSRGEEEGHTGDALKPLCEESGGQLCLQVLYADAYATEDGRTSHAESESGVADVCVGGSRTDPTARCDGPVAASVAKSHSEAHRNQHSGRTTASSSSDVAVVCLQRDPGTGACALTVGVLHSEGESDSGGASPSASRSSYLARVAAGGEEIVSLEDGAAGAIPPECVQPALICAFVNQGETYVGDDVAGHAQEVLHVDLLAGTPLDLLGIEIGRTETLVHKDGGEAPNAAGDETTRPDVPSGGPRVLGVSAALPGTGVLPNTGGLWSGLLAAALFAIGSGALTVARSRRSPGPQA